MQTYQMTCPKCGAQIQAAVGDSFEVCGSCQTRVTCPEQMRGGAQVIFHDHTQGARVAHAIIPQGWSTNAVIEFNGVLDIWVTVKAEATSPNGRERLSYENMAAYRCIEGDGRGMDGPVYDTQEHYVWWRYHRADAYCDALAARLTNGAARIVRRMEVPGKIGEQYRSPAIYQQIYAAEQQIAASFNAGVGGLATKELLGMEMTDSLGLYRVEGQGTPAALVIAACVKCVRIRDRRNMGPLLGGAGLFAAMMGGTNLQGLSGTSVYLEWRPMHYVMLTPWPLAQESLTVFSTFVDSLDLIEDVRGVAQRYSQNFQMELQNMRIQQERRWDAVRRVSRQRSADLDRWRADQAQMRSDMDAWRSQTFEPTPSYTGSGESVDDRIQRLRHEAMMDVDTYERADGTTVEFDNRAERVFESNYDTTYHVGTEGYWDDYVPDGWTELDRKW